MNLREATTSVRSIIFRMARAVSVMLPARRMKAFGKDGASIGSILVINLDRQPDRWRKVVRELGRFRTSGGERLDTVTRRLAAIDARDGREVAATADVDPVYTMKDQLFVQPDIRLEACFGPDQQIRMTRQEIAVARSHIEAWKAVASGDDEHVLICEDDIWFTRGAASLIDCGWQAARDRSSEQSGPHLLYLSYRDAGGTAERKDVCKALFVPLRGLWFLSGYVLSRKGAATLLRAMPVVGPVDLWINYRFGELGALALASPAILQREDFVSQNAYSVLPYLARAGIVDAGDGQLPRPDILANPVLVWTARAGCESIPMALSMLGLRVRVFDGDEAEVGPEELSALLSAFDALIDVPLAPVTLDGVAESTHAKFIVERSSEGKFAVEPSRLPIERTTTLPANAEDQWLSLCGALGLSIPSQAYPVGSPRGWRMFRHDRSLQYQLGDDDMYAEVMFDDSPWVMPGSIGWQPRPISTRPAPVAERRNIFETANAAGRHFTDLVETFPGNTAFFTKEGVEHLSNGTRLILSDKPTGDRPYRSGAFASKRLFMHGQFEAEIKAARGSGMVTGFFLHRELPRQEIDIELLGRDPCAMLVNVYFNPGDDGAAIGYGYRGSPFRIELDFDTTADFHTYSIDWQVDRIAWYVDGRLVHERLSWDPTPIPHLEMRLHANLWTPRSVELAGRLDVQAVPAIASFRNLAVLSSGRL